MSGKKPVLPKLTGKEKKDLAKNIVKRSGKLVKDVKDGKAGKK